MKWAIEQVRWKCKTCYRRGIAYVFFDNTYSMGNQSHVIVGNYPNECWVVKHEVVEFKRVPVPDGCIVVWDEREYGDR